MRFLVLLAALVLVFWLNPYAGVFIVVLTGFWLWREVIEPEIETAAATRQAKADEDAAAQQAAHEARDAKAARDAAEDARLAARLAGSGDGGLAELLEDLERPKRRP